MIFQTLKSNKGNLIKGPLLLSPEVFNDERGFFYESWNQEKFNNVVGSQVSFSQDNVSFSKKSVLRGMHYQITPNPQSKLVRCVNGEIYDVAVDLRKNSPNFGEWISVILNSENKLQLWIPEGFAHGFLSLREKNLVNYKASGYWDSKCEKTLNWNDKAINISWPLEYLNNNDLIISEKDKLGKSFDELITNNDIFL